MKAKKRKISKIPRHELLALIETLEKFMVQLNYSKSDMAYLKKLSDYIPDEKIIGKETKGQFKKIKKDIEQASSMIVSLNMKKQKKDERRASLRYGALIEMKGIIEDKEFHAQLEKAKPGTKELLNCIILDATKNQMAEYRYRQEQIKVLDTKYGRRASNLLINLRSCYQKLVKIQMINNSKQVNDDIDMMKLMMSYDSPEREGENNS